MLQKPGERPDQVEEEDDEEEEEKEEEKEEVKEEGEGRLGDPTREPGTDAGRRIDPDLLLPFRCGSCSSTLDLAS